MGDFNEIWDAVDIIELVGLTEEVEKKKKREKEKRHRGKREIHEMPDDWEVEKSIDFVRDRWDNVGLPKFRRCVNDVCPIKTEYGEPAYWTLRLQDVKVVVRYIDQYELLSYIMEYDTIKVTTGLYCPFCKSLGQLVYEREVEDILQKFIDFSEHHTEDYDKFINSLLDDVREVPIYSQPSKPRGMQVFEWRKGDKSINLSELKKSRFIPPMDCEFKSCNHYEPTDCDHLKCVIGEIIWNRLQSDVLIQEMLK